MAKKKKKIDLISQVDTSDINLDDVDVTANIVELPKAASVRTRRRQSVRGGQGRKKNKRNRTQSQSSEHGDEFSIPKVIGVLPLRNVVVFPGTVTPLAVGRPRSQRLLTELTERESVTGGTSSIESSGETDKVIGALTQKDPETDDPGYNDLHRVGTIVTILKKLKLPEGQNSLVVHGLMRFRVVEWLAREPFLKARIEIVESQIKPGRNLEALVTNVRNMANQMVELSPNIPDEVHVILNNIEEPGALADFLAANININVPQKQEILDTFDVNERLRKLSVSLASQIELLELSAKIQSKVSQSIDKSQREYFLQEQLKAIQKELGQFDQKTAEIEELKERIDNAEMPEKVQAEALRELDRLSKIPTMSPEFSVSRNYVEWLCELPWSKSTTDKLNLNSARRILNADHYNLVKVKKRVLEFLAVRKLNPTGRSPILCFVGPPGVGKTSLGRSIARSMGRKFIRISLGGIRDEADIRGHRRTYIGAMPGRILQELRKCGSHNPVFMLDELDKIGQDFRGDPASALLEVLDPEQNNTFTDHFIDQPFDLSRVLFIGTANYMGTVPAALRDRLEVMELLGYTANEKLLIAQRYLVPRQLKENGLTEKILKIKQDALVKLIESYTREAGVRELERKIAAICRAVAAEIASNKRKTAAISAGRLPKLLGPATYESELALRTNVPGVATGLAYTPVGGEILFVESTVIPGKGQLILTGQLGDVMKESAQTALSALKSLALTKSRSKSSSNGILSQLRKVLSDENTISKQNIHIHVPAGAVPKDGPSAGLAMYTSMASLLVGRAVRGDIAMTGEITLRGNVLPIGGVKEKLLAAKRAGIKTVILPDRNRKDLVDLQKEVTRGLKLEFVRSVEKVLRIALETR
ncbi:MAG: endopeptidase La [Sedimentisphaerales bacterium]|nr:endopeptidase La [Sedimentisphaerales bacterium]